MHIIKYMQEWLLNREARLMSLFEYRVALIATMHGKDKVIGPLLQKAGLTPVLAPGLNTDRFGTFTGEIPRKGTMLDAARAKAEVALGRSDYDLAIASEGSFGPHPRVPFLAGNQEIVLLLDRRNGIELVGRYMTSVTNFGHQVVATLEEAFAFAENVGFPAHGLIVRDHHEPNEGSVVAKGVVSRDALVGAVTEALQRSPGGMIVIQTDMRALCNPTRLAAISMATQDLLAKLRSLCPKCHFPGFDAVDSLPGLPCEECQRPTERPIALVLACIRCHFREQRRFPQAKSRARVVHCLHCNP